MKNSKKVKEQEMNNIENKYVKQKEKKNMKCEKRRHTCAKIKFEWCHRNYFN